MRALIASVLALLLALSPISLSADEPKLGSIQRLFITAGDDTGSCTTFSIREHIPGDKSRGYWLTAAHCTADGATYTIGGVLDMYVQRVDYTADLAILVGPSAKALKWADRAPKAGETVELRGFAFGYSELLRTWGKVSLPYSVEYAPELWPENSVIHGTSAPGMSGGPILRKGKVIGVIQGHYLGYAISLGSVWETTRDFTEGYWARQP